MLEIPLSLVRRFKIQITLLTSAYFIIFWTCLRFFTRPSTYDLTTQQVLAHSWLHGYNENIVLGSTNYLLKIFLFYMPMDLIHGLPKVKLLVLTILINLLTYLLIFIALKKILAEFKIKAGAMLYIAMVWLSMIAGSEFWVQYANSRNLEVAGALFVLLGALRFIRAQTRKNFIYLCSLATLVFFADNLMFYMVAAPILIYILVLAVSKNITWRVASLGSAALIGSFGLSLLISKLVYKILNITINSTSATQPLTSLSGLANAIKQAAHASLRQLDGGLDAGRSFMLICTSLLVIGLIIIIKDIINRGIPRRLILLIVCFMVINETVYIISGKAAQADTSRYLIMLGPIIALSIASLSIDKIAKLIKLITIVAIGIGVVLIGRTTLLAWHSRELPDDHLISVARYIKTHNYQATYASLDTATPLAYYTNLIVSAPYPKACSGTKLVHASSYRNEPKLATQAKVALILDGVSINNNPSECSSQAIIDQLGLPLSRDLLDDGSQVLVYPNSKLLYL